MVHGRTAYELMEGYWPAVARDEKAPRAERGMGAQAGGHAEIKRVGLTPGEFPWKNSFHMEGDLGEAVTEAQGEDAPKGVLVGRPDAFRRARSGSGLIDEYHFVVQPVLAGHGPYLVPGPDCPRGNSTSSR